MLREGFDRNSIAAAVRVTPGQVSATAAHLTMQTYKKETSSTALQDARGPEERLEPKGAEKKAAIKIPIGKDTKSGKMSFWCPTPDSGTPNPHLLIVSESGSGKTYATPCICAELAQRDLPTIVFDFGQGFA